MTVDYSKIGLKVGIEIHQQLQTAHKLFCVCKPELSVKEPEIKFYRRLRPTQSELGEVDPAAAFEYRKGRGFLYEADNETSCLVEMDEEPPHNLNDEAIDICLTVALIFGASIVDEIHVMRKIVIDGSNTTGFQRTCVVALGGGVDIEGKRVPIQTICLEEDAARKTGEEGFTLHYRIDRLGIPLIEVATAPVVHSPEEAERVALSLGRILRATGRVKRGIGTIRQDLNISIRDGALIEVKGVQKLELVSRVVEFEVQRQLTLLKIREELIKRNVDKEGLGENFVDVTQIFRGTKCRVIGRVIERGGVVLAVVLSGFWGLLKTELEPGVRFGTELADQAKFWGGVGGIFHSDELPGYGINGDEVKKLKETLGTGEGDAVVIVADELENATDALKAVVERAREAIDGVPSETRGSNPDGTTHYSRPRPGAARMYPETDVPPVPITESRIREIRANLPELPERKLIRLVKQYDINRKLALQLMDSDYLGLFEIVAQVTEVPTSFIAASLTETMKSLEREGFEVEKISDSQIEAVFKLVDSGTVAKEAVIEIFKWLTKNEGVPPEVAVKALGLEIIPRNQLEVLIEKVVNENVAVIEKRGMGALGPLMGIVMEKVRGRADARLVSQLLRERVEKLTKRSRRLII